VSKGEDVQGTILILDGVSTNRIMLKVQLSAAYYHVVQADGLAGLSALVRRTRPDLIVTAMSLPDGDALDLRALLAADAHLAAIPVIAITPQNDRAARLRVLAAGIDDVLSHPLDDVILQARIRSLIRARSSAEDLRLQGGASRALGLAEPAVGFVAAPLRQARVALVTQTAATGAVWRARLKKQTAHQLDIYQMGDMHALLGEPTHDAIVIELPATRAEPGSGVENGAGLRLLADLRARATTRTAAVIAIPNPANPHLAAEALDRGAHDVLPGGFCTEELILRLDAQLRHKAQADQLRDNVHNGLRAAVLDPMTGLYNRRYALPRLAHIARQAVEKHTCFAVMLADLDHFKHINDRFGHPAGDAVLVETAHRLLGALRPDDMIARVGGEEFLIVMPATSQESAVAAADRLCSRINRSPYFVPGQDQPIDVTISIGVVVSPQLTSQVPTGCEQATARMITQADRALYEAKDAGRNQVTLIRPAA